MTALLAAAALTLLAGCDNPSSDAGAREDHVFKDQVQAIDKAREVETILKRKPPEQQ